MTESFRREKPISSSTGLPRRRKLPDTWVSTMNHSRVPTFGGHCRPLSQTPKAISLVQEHFKTSDEQYPCTTVAHYRRRDPEAISNGHRQHSNTKTEFSRKRGWCLPNRRRQSDKNNFIPADFYIYQSFIIRGWNNPLGNAIISAATYECLICW